MPGAPRALPSWSWIAAALLIALALVAIVVGWGAQRRVHELEKELVRRQQESQNTATEARAFAAQAQDSAREAAAKTALLEARVAEVAMQRGQLEDLIQSLSRSRDENVLVDIEAAIRVATQQSAITGSAEPLVTALRHADERLERYGQPRLEGVRRAIARDLDRVKAVGVADISSLNIRLDEAVRLVDDLPLLAVAERKAPGRASGSGASQANAPVPADGSPGTASGGGANASGTPAAAQESRPAWWSAIEDRFGDWTQAVWAEARSLVRVTRIDHPEAMLIAPEQAFFIRENLKLRLLNARLAVLSRQFETAQADLHAARTTLDRYFDRNSRKVGVASELIRQVAAQARNVSLPRPDDTLAALATANAGR